MSPSLSEAMSNILHKTSTPVLDALTEFLAGNLKQEKEKTFPRYLESFLSHIRNFRGGVSRQNDSGEENDTTKENAAVNESTRKEATETKIKQSNKLRGTENIVAIRLTPFDYPETSKSPGTNKKSISKTGQSKAKSTQNKAVQMSQNSSTQRLQEDEDINDDSSLDIEDVERAQKYILVGWDNFRSKLMVVLLVLLVLWAVIYFPLIGT
ncbi:PREDICTED: uncharacterized protein LOC108555950 [Eufriesea mexicana]|uniref:uncharacterized protein LOC108555950 n=1 Tax=Eufriesea mexicana TaxID=516756 RepID=UPI00083BEC5E|nr:PREDICTED: uncharacterized protein LOC108555950 [Eufriesea mexicana]